MQKIKVLSGQSLYDIAVQYTGDAANTYLIAQVNSKAVTDVLATNEIITIPDGLQLGSRELKYLAGLGILPATGITIDQENVLIPQLGIGTMTIGTTFIVG